MNTLINTLHKLFWACVIIILIAFFILAVFGCKTTKVEDFSDHWANHAVKFDTNGIDKTLQ